MDSFELMSNADKLIDSWPWRIARVKQNNGKPHSAASLGLLIGKSGSKMSEWINKKSKPTGTNFLLVEGKIRQLEKDQNIEPFTA